VTTGPGTRPSGPGSGRAPAAWRPAAALPATLLIAFALTGCASRHPDGAGWRLAVVTRLDATLPPHGQGSADCRRLEASTEGAAPRYAEVAYRLAFHSRRRIALLPESGDFAVGEDVYVNIRDCTLPIRPTVP